jgi:phenylpropionate dioxygenase-like ring-hydroxylating dioxygenase large terminal subunit
MAVTAVFISCLFLLLRVESFTAFTNVAPTKKGIQRCRPFSLPVTTSPSGVQDTTADAGTITSTSTSSEPSSEPDPDAIHTLRPFHQNWWPVSALNALDTAKPNGLQILGKHLVAAWNQADSTWTVLDDRCSHRFAPLSEGRVLHPAADSQAPSSVQCAYHGWQFEATTGQCTTVPQQQDRVDKARSVASYPAMARAGLLWVWADPATRTLSTTVPLPVDPLLDRYVDHFGNDSCFMRDLPYGMEILGENLLDLSHLPFAHHSVGILNRELGRELPTKMLSQPQKIKNADWEKEYNPEGQVVLPTFQAEIIQAAQHDPILKGILTTGMGDPRDADNWTTTIAFYDPCHVRYRRWRGPGLSSHVELFLCPTSEGRSRVFLYNVVESMLPSKLEKKSTLQQYISIALKPSAWPSGVKMALVKKLFDPRRAAGHMITHKIFDGDGIFLHKQGNRMKQAGLSFRDYSTPSSADALLNAYRRFIDIIASKTRETGLEDIADAVVGSAEYGDDAPRSEMLDRYNTHTIKCPQCMTALRQTRAKKTRVRILQTALQGATGTSLTALTTLVAVTRFATVSLTPGVIRTVAGMAAATCLGSIATAHAEKRLDKDINQFLFEDYVHAEKH